MKTTTVTWPGGEHEFALPIGQLRALQDACKSGPEEIFNRLRLGTWKVDDLVNVLKFGLIGGGMSKADAAPLVVGLFDTHPPFEFKLAAIGVLASALMGDLLEGEDVPGKPEGETPQPLGSSEKSTELAQ